MGPSQCHPVLAGETTLAVSLCPVHWAPRKAPFALCSQYLSNAYYVPGMALGTGEQNNCCLCPWVVHIRLQEMG